MSILALVTSPEEIVLVVPWAAKVASVRESSLTILCWSYSPTPQPPEIMNIEALDIADSLVVAVRDFISQPDSTLSADDPSRLASQFPAVQDAIIQRLSHPDATAAMLERIVQEEPILAIAEPTPTIESPAKQNLTRPEPGFSSVGF